MKKEPRKTVIVGSLLDWPLGARLATLLSVPAPLTRVGCYQVIGKHGDEVAAAVTEPDGPPAAFAGAPRLTAALEVCTHHRGAYAVGFHGALTPAALRARLEERYLVRSPAEAAEARIRTPAKSLAAIAKAMEAASGSGLPKKRVLAWLEKGGKMIDVESDALAYVFVADPEAASEVDQRLLSLWAHNLSAVSTRFPTPSPGAPELGFDRLGLYSAALTASGVAPAVVDRLLATRWSQQVRMFPSTGVRVWEQMARDSKAFSAYALDQEHGAHHLVSVLAAMLELPASALAVGAGELLRSFCADASLVPEETLEKLRRDPSYRAILEGITRHGTPVTGRPFQGGMTTGVPLRDLKA